MVSRPRLAVVIAAGIAITVAVAVLVSPFASSEPDGLERVAIDEGFDHTASDHALADGPTADYAVDGVDDEGLSTGLAGLIGVAVTFALAAGLTVLARRTGGRRRSDPGCGDRPEQRRAGARSTGG